MFNFALLLKYNYIILFYSLNYRYSYNTTNTEDQNLFGDQVIAEQVSSAACSKTFVSANHEKFDCN